MGEENEAYHFFLSNISKFLWWNLIKAVIIQIKYGMYVVQNKLFHHNYVFKKIIS